MLKSDQGAFVLEHLSEEHLSGEYLSGEHLTKEHLSGEHLSREHVSGEHMSKEHVPWKLESIDWKACVSGSICLEGHLSWEILWGAFVSGSILPLPLFGILQDLAHASICKARTKCLRKYRRFFLGCLLFFVLKTRINRLCLLRFFLSSFIFLIQSSTTSLR